MENHISPALKRYNYLFGETDAVYHEISLKLGLSDSAMKILYTICDNDTSCLILQAENDIFASWPQEDVQKYLELTETFLLALREKSKSIASI